MSFMSSHCKYRISVESRSRENKGALQLFTGTDFYPEKRGSARHMPVSHSQFCIIEMKGVEPEVIGGEAEALRWSG